MNFQLIIVNRQNRRKLSHHTIGTLLALFSTANWKKMENEQTNKQRNNCYHLPFCQFHPSWRIFWHWFLRSTNSNSLSHWPVAANLPVGEKRRFLMPFSFIPCNRKRSHLFKRNLRIWERQLPCSPTVRSCRCWVKVFHMYLLYHFESKESRPFKLRTILITKQRSCSKPMYPGDLQSTRSHGYSALYLLRGVFST